GLATPGYPRLGYVGPIGKPAPPPSVGRKMPARLRPIPGGVAFTSPHRRPDRLRPRRVEPHHPGRPVQPDARAAPAAPPTRVDAARTPGRMLPAAVQRAGAPRPAAGGAGRVAVT